MTPTHCDRPMIAIEFPEVYDGVSAWVCERCHYWQHRWPEGDRRRDRTARLMPPFVVALDKDRKDQP